MFRVFHNARYPYIDVKQPQEDLTELVEVGDDRPFILHPGEFVLGSTLERVRLPDDLVARLEGKALALDTPVPTTQGWTTMGELRPGDLVFDEEGFPTVVLAATEPMLGRPCREVVFSDSTSVVCDVDHLWRTIDKNGRRYGGAATTWSRRARSSGRSWCGASAITRYGSPGLFGIRSAICRSTPTCSVHGSVTAPRRPRRSRVPMRRSWRRWRWPVTRSLRSAPAVSIPDRWHRPHAQRGHRAVRGERLALERPSESRAARSKAHPGRVPERVDRAARGAAAGLMDTTDTSTSSVAAT